MKQHFLKIFRGYNKIILLAVMLLLGSNFLYAQSNDPLYIDSAGNVYIKVKKDNKVLSVEGNAIFSDTLSVGVLRSIKELTVVGTAEFKSNVGIGIATPAASAQLDVSSTTKGLLPPRMTSIQRDSIASPATGLVIFNTITNGLEFKDSSGWVSLTTASVVFLPTVVIGTQQWMQKNLEVAFYRNGDSIPQVTDPKAWVALTTGAWCYYDNDPNTGYTYGKLYNWYAVNDKRGLAPAGWHIPTNAEWITVEDSSLGGSSVAGGKMKEPGDTHWGKANTGDNSSAWAGLPGGYRSNNGAFSDVRYYGGWWSSTEGGTTGAWARGLFYDGGRVGTSNGDKQVGLSVRCLRD